MDDMKGVGGWLREGEEVFTTSSISGAKKDTTKIYDKAVWNCKERLYELSQIVKATLVL